MAVSGCEPTQTCTAIGTPAGLVLRFEAGEGATLPASTYEIILDVDGDVYSLACGKPDDEADFTCEEAEGSGDHTITHEDELGSSRFFDIRIVSYGDDVTAGPEHVVVEVIAGDAPLVDAAFEPEYERDEPNGEGCGLVDHEVVQSVVIDVGG